MPALKRLAPWSVALVGLGAVAGVVWSWLAEPSEWEVTTEGIVLTEDAVRSQFESIVVFVIVGAVLCALWAVVAGHVLRDVGWVLVPVFATVAGLASVVAWRVGVALGPSEHPSQLADDPARVAELSIGDQIPAPLEIDAVAPFLMWPICALAGLLVAAWLDRSDDESGLVDYAGDPSTRSAP